MGVVLALFDLDNTLVDREAAFRRWAADFARQRGLRDGAVAWLCQAEEDGLARRETLFGAARERFGLHESVDQLVAGYRTAYPGFFRPDSAVSGALARLRRAGWRIGVVTNGPSGQHDKMARAALSELVDACCVSDEVGVAKPDPLIFTEAIRRCGGRPDDPAGIWMVGDAPGPDIGGARALGLRTVWIHRDRSWGEPDYGPDVVVADVPEAVEAILGV